MKETKTGRWGRAIGRRLFSIGKPRAAFLRRDRDQKGVSKGAMKPWEPPRSSVPGSRNSNAKPQMQNQARLASRNARRAGEAGVPGRREEVRGEEAGEEARPRSPRQKGSVCLP